jgi:hypothetical protein
MLTFDALADGVDADDVVREILRAVPPPVVVWNQGQSQAQSQAQAQAHGWSHGRGQR